MKFDEIAKILKDIPATPPNDGRVLYDFILKGDFPDILELGFAHGTSTCYMAAALAEKQAGHILTIDREEARDLTPDIHETLARTGLGEFVEPVFAKTSYTWELMKIIEKQTTEGICRPCFDFCFIDGAHSWETDGLAFFLAGKLLRPGGWLLFDDLYWTYESSMGLKDSEMVRNMPEEERATPQVKKIFTLLAGQHPDFGNARVNDRWGWIQKKGTESGGLANTPGLLDLVYERQSIKPEIKNIMRKLKRRIFKPAGS